jgi:predicted  nucleic acid-binding Zn-ribbon protein
MNSPSAGSHLHPPLPLHTPLSVPEPTTNEEIARLHRRRQELQEQSEQIEKRLEQLQNELKKVTGRIVLPDDARREHRPASGS